MDPFVRQLVQRMHDPKRPLSRNRHFHTFSTPEGRRAMQMSRRLRSLQRDILSCAEAGQPACISTETLPEGGSRILLRMLAVHGSRESHLHPDEFELLLELEGVRAALDAGGESESRFPVAAGAASAD